MDYVIYREELAIKHPVFGHALWKPSPGEYYTAVQVGDVGFTHEGYFHRLFNILLPTNHESHRGGVPQNHEPLMLRTSTPATYTGTLQSNHLLSKGVSDVSDLDARFATVQEPRIAFSCSGRQGAVLSLPLPAHSQDTAAGRDFAKCMVNHIDEWFAFARNSGFDISRREDIILVTGRHLARSWANAVFKEKDERVSFRVDVKGNSGVKWDFTHEGRGGVVYNLGPGGENLPENQCIFIRGFRVTRFTTRLLRRLQAAAGPAPIPRDDPDDPECDMKLTYISGNIRYQDPLHTLLEYITEQAPDGCDMAIVHDDNLLCIDNTSLESLRPDMMMSYLRKSAPRIWQVQCDRYPSSQGGEGVTTADGPPQITVTKVATLSKDMWQSPAGSITSDTTFDMNELRATTSSRPWPPPSLGSFFSRCTAVSSRWWPPQTLSSLFSRFTAVLSRWWQPPTFGVFFSRFTTVCQWLRWTFRPHLYDSDSDRAKRERLPDDVEWGLREDNENGLTPKRRALLVGISYEHSLCDEFTGEWEVLDGTHKDVECFRKLLIQTYGYSPEDIVVLKDDPKLPGLSQPTRDNMIRELKRLVAGAAPGDKFTFLYSGHSDQQDAVYDPDEEDGLDEVMITSDLQRIVDDDLNGILVKKLPDWCSLVAILDTCHSGTLLDLPHYYCNDLYVPWLSKGQRCTKTYHNKNVRGNALDFVGFPGSAFRRHTSFTSVMTSQWLKDAPSGSPLRIITEIDDDSLFPMKQYKASAEADPQEAHARRFSIPPPLLSSERQFSSPVDVRCDGWCGDDLTPRATVLSLSARVDLHRAWEGPRGSLTAVLCRFLEKRPNPSYRTLMSHVNFQLYENCLALHEYTRDEKKKAAQGEGSGFDGGLNNFQSPQLSSLSKLKMSDILRL